MKLTPAARARLLLLATYAASVLLCIMPGPVWAEPLRPDWVALVLVYWCLALPQRVGVGTGWALGLVMDVLYGSLLGLHAATKGLVAYLAVKFHPQFRMFPRWQQALGVGVLLVVNQFVVLWVRGAIGKAPDTVAYWTPAIVGALVWPWLFIVLRDIRRRGDIR
jgi:rod shape-determining protein MreD